MTDLDALTALLAAATSDDAEMPVPLGNWRAEQDDDGYWSINATGDGKRTAIHTHITFGPLEETHRLIVAAVNALPALIEAARREAGLREVLDGLARTVARFLDSDPLMQKPRQQMRAAVEYAHALLHDNADEV